MRVLSRRSVSTMRCAEVRKPSLTWGGTPCSVLGYKIFIACSVSLFLVMLCLWVARQVERMRAQKMLSGWLKQPDSLSARERLANMVVSLRQRRTLSEDHAELTRHTSVDHTQQDHHHHQHDHHPDESSVQKDSSSHNNNNNSTPHPAYSYCTSHSATSSLSSSSSASACEERCIICYGSLSAVAVELLPCGHYQMCAPCVLHLWRSGGLSHPIRCPLCRQRVHFICPAYELREQCKTVGAAEESAGWQTPCSHAPSSPVNPPLVPSLATSANASFATARSDHNNDEEDERYYNNNNSYDNVHSGAEGEEESGVASQSLAQRARGILHSWLTMWPRRYAQVHQPDHSYVHHLNHTRHTPSSNRARSPPPLSPPLSPTGVGAELTAAQIENAERMLFRNYNRKFWRLQYGEAAGHGGLPWHERWVRRLRVITDAHYLPAIVAIRISLLHVSMLAYLMLPQDYMPYSFYGCGGYGRGGGGGSTNSNGGNSITSSATSTLLLASSAVQQKSYSLSMAAASFISSFLRPCAATRVWCLPSARVLSVWLMRVGGLADAGLSVVLYYSFAAVELLMRSTDDIFMIVFGVILVGDLLHRLLFDGTQSIGPE